MFPLLVAVLLLLVAVYLRYLYTLKQRIAAMPKPTLAQRVRDRVVGMVQELWETDVRTKMDLLCVVLEQVPEKLTTAQGVAGQTKKALSFYLEHRESIPAVPSASSTERGQLVSHYNWWATPLWLFGFVDRLS